MSFSKRASRSLSLALAAIAFLPVAALRAQHTRPSDLAEASLEELLNIEVVSVSRKQQPLAQTPAAVYVLTAEDIRRSGARTIPELLRLVPGMQVGRLDTSTWSVSARGYGGEFANKLLVMIDGRSVYTPIYGGVFWDSIDVPMEDIDRIEVIRGPGGTMWGANATNGVVNIITKPSQETLGASVILGGGSSEAGIISLRQGGKLGRGTTYRIFGKGDATLGFDYPGDAEVRPWRRARAGFRSDSDLGSNTTLMLEGDVFAGGLEQILKIPQRDAPYSRTTASTTRTTGGYLMARLVQGSINGSNSVYQVYFDRQSRSNELKSPEVSTLDGEYQRRIPTGRHDLLMGGGARFWRSSLPSTIFGPVLSETQNTGLLNGFVQDEISLAESLRFTAGAKLEYSTYAGTQIQPGVRLMWAPSARSSYWTSFSRAVRTPSRMEREVDALVDYSMGNNGIPTEIRLQMDPQFGYEKLWALEAGWRSHLTKTTTADVAVFRNWYSDMALLTRTNPSLAFDPVRFLLPVSYRNGEAVDGSGVDAWVSWNPKSTIRVQASYSWMNLTTSKNTPSLVARDLAEGRYPMHQGMVRTMFNLPRQLEFDATAYAVSRRPANQTSGYVRLDTRLGWRPSPSWEFSAVGQDLGQGGRREFLSDSYTQSVLVGRRIYGMVQWHR